MEFSPPPDVCQSQTIAPHDIGVKADAVVFDFHSEGATITKNTDLNPSRVRVPDGVAGDLGQDQSDSVERWRIQGWVFVGDIDLDGQVRRNVEPVKNSR